MAERKLKVTKSVCLPPLVLERLEGYRNSLPTPTPSFSEVLSDVLSRGLSTLGR